MWRVSFRRIVSLDLALAADSAGEPAGDHHSTPGRVSTFSAGPDVSPILVTGSPLHSGGQVRVRPGASFFPSFTHSLNIRPVALPELKELTVRLG